LILKPSEEEADMAKNGKKPKPKEVFTIIWDDSNGTLEVDVEGIKGKFKRAGTSIPWDHDSGAIDWPAGPPNQDIVVDKQSPGCIYVRTGAGWKRV
jgi:hypothetical protein